MGCMKRLLAAFAVLAATLAPGAAPGDDTIERALSLAAEQRLAEAREALDPLLAREPGNPRARLLHGILRAREGEVGEAIDIFEALRRDHPDMAEPYNNLAVLYAVQGRLDDAREVLVAALERRPAAVVYANLGDVYTELARRAYARARAAETVGGPSPEQEAFTVFEAPAMPAGAPRTGSAGAATPPRELAMTPPDVAAQPEAPVMPPPEAMRKPPESRSGRGASAPPGPGSANESPEDAPAAPDTGTPAAVAGRRAPDTEPREAGETTAGMAPAAPADAFCAYAAGFQSRRAVADAALWLQARGAEVTEVRHEERRIATSHRVYLPPFESRERAVAKLREIRNRGVRDVVVIQDGALADGISFGIYRNVDNMQRRIAALGRLGYTVRSQAEDVEVFEEYVIRARAGGAPETLDAAWTSRFPEHSIRVVDCG